MKATTIASLFVILFASVTMATTGYVYWDVRITSDAAGNNLVANVPENKIVPSGTGGVLYFTTSVRITGDNQGLGGFVYSVGIWDTTNGPIWSGQEVIVPYTFSATPSYPNPLAANQWAKVYDPLQIGAFGAIRDPVYYNGPGLDQSPSLGIINTDNKAYISQVGAGILDYTPGVQAWGVGLLGDPGFVLNATKSKYDVQRVKFDISGAMWQTGHAYTVAILPSSSAVIKPGIDLSQDPPDPPGYFSGIIEAITSAIGSVNGGQASFFIGPSPPPTITGALSRKVHGSAGTFDIDVKATGAVECRTAGPTLLVVTFDQPIQMASGTPADVSLSSGTVTGLTTNGNQLTITMSGASDAALLTVGFPGIRGTSGLTATGTLCFGVLYGDATGDKKVNVFDLLNIKTSVNQPVAASNYRADATANGGINVFDLLAAKNNMNKTITGSCP